MRRAASFERLIACLLLGAACAANAAGRPAQDDGDWWLTPARAAALPVPPPGPGNGTGPGMGIRLRDAGEAAAEVADGDDEADDDETPIAEGMASWYGARFHRRRTASGEVFDMYQFTAAHPTLPFGTWLCVRSQVNGTAIRVRINDRGPHTGSRIIDLSRAAAQALGLLDRGTKPVELWPDGRC